jgi:hypothetical protein
MKTKFQSGRHWIAFFLLGLSALANPLLKPDEPAKAATSPNPQAAEETLNNNTVIELVKLGLGESLVIDKIKASRCNFDVSITGIKQLKSSSVPDGVISAMLAASKGVTGRLNESSGDPNDPKSDEKPKLTKTEPSVYSQQKTGAAFFAAYGQTAKSKAVLHPAQAVLRTSNRKPVFYFYFENTKSGLGETMNTATSPNEFVLAQFECKDKDNLRQLVVGQFNAYSGSQFGPEDKAIRAFDFEKLLPGIYKVCPKQDLANGEYGFFYGGHSAGGGGKVFDFAIQGSPNTEPRSTTDKKSKVKAAKD